MSLRLILTVYYAATAFQRTCFSCKRSATTSAIAQDSAQKESITQRQRQKRIDHCITQASHQILAAKKIFQPGLEEKS